MCRLKVKVTANSHRPGLVALVDGQLHIKVAASPVDGKANKEVCQTIAKLLKIAESSVEIKSGHSARIKTLLINDIDDKQLSAILRQHLGAANS